MSIMMIVTLERLYTLIMLEKRWEMWWQCHKEFWNELASFRNESIVGEQEFILVYFRSILVYFVDGLTLWFLKLGDSAEFNIIWDNVEKKKCNLICK